nr:MAG: hypothetical protein DIU55_09070 [Bacillota bacterium]
MRLRNGLLTAILAGLLILGISAFLPQAAPAQAAEDNSVRTISVVGRGQLEVKPDTAVITVGVSEVRPTPIEAYNALSERINAVSQALMAKGVKEDDIQTSTFQLSPEYNWTQERGQELVGYRATNTLSITTQNLDKVAELIQVAVQAGANDLRGINFSVKNSDKLLEQALKRAVADAKAKAELVAGELGARVARVQSVSVQDQGSSPVMVWAEVRAEMDKLAAQAPVPVYAGTTTFTATVSVTFELQ